MALEEKRAWIMIGVTIIAYATYLTIILGRSADTPLTEAPYVATLLWSVGAAVAAHIAVAIASPEGADRKDERDREINRLGEYTGQAFVVIGGLAALAMSMARMDHFWIASAVFLAFVLSAILSSAAKTGAHHHAFQPW